MVQDRPRVPRALSHCQTVTASATPVGTLPNRGWDGHPGLHGPGTCLEGRARGLTHFLVISTYLEMSPSEQGPLGPRKRTVLSSALGTGNLPLASVRHHLAANLAHVITHTLHHQQLLLRPLPTDSGSWPGSWPLRPLRPFHQSHFQHHLAPPLPLSLPSAPHHSLSSFRASRAAGTQTRNTVLLELPRDGAPPLAAPIKRGPSPRHPSVRCPACHSYFFMHT